MSYAPSVIRSIQYLEGSVAVPNGTNATRTVSLGTTLTNTGKAVIVQSQFGDQRSGAGNGNSATNKFDLRGGWYISNTTTAAISQTGNLSNGDGTIYYAFSVVEYY